MTIQSIYLGTRMVKRIYRNRKIVWPMGSGELSLELLQDLFSSGFHALSFGDVVALAAEEMMSSVVSLPDAALSVLESVSLHGELESRTGGERAMDPLPAVIFLCNAASATSEELDLIAANAVTFDKWEDSGTTSFLESLVAGAVYGDHQEDIAANQEVPMIVADAAYGTHREDQGTKQEVSMIVPDAAYLAHKEDSGTQERNTMDVAEHVPLAANLDSSSSSELNVLPVNVQSIVTMDMEGEDRSDFEGNTEPEEAVSMGALLHMVTTCEAHLTVANAADVHLEESIGSAFDGDLSFNVPGGGEEEEYEWFEPVRTGNNLYIRSAHSVWTDGDSANIDTAFFLEPVQEGSNLHIRQDIFGGK